MVFLTRVSGLYRWSVTEMGNTARILLRSSKFMVGIFIIIAIILTIIIYPLINTGNPTEMKALAYQPPSKDMVLGSDNFGRDVLLELVYGTRNSLLVGILAGVIATAIGIIIGLLAGYAGGITDDLLTALTNIFLVIPQIVILILITVSLKQRSLVISAVIIGLTTWPWTARSVRAQTSSLRNREHVNIAKISGYNTSKIIVSEILPYIASYIAMAFILQIGSGIIIEATLSMLGLGPYNTITLGIMLQWSILFEAPAAGAWWAFIPVCLSVAFITFSLYLMNSGMDEIFNPKIRS